MLILTRYIQESIIIGKDIHIKVLGVCGGSVRLGIDAPKEYSVHREEIYQRIQAGADGNRMPTPAVKEKVARTIDSPADSARGK